MFNWLRRWLPDPPGRAIPDALWDAAIAQYRFLAELPASRQLLLRTMAGRFLAHKQFAGAHGLEITDAIAVAIAAQACLPVLDLGLGYYDDFRGIVVHPGAMIARRTITDAAGVVHQYSEVLSGEAMELGPVTLSWQDAAGSGDLEERGHNVVIHEFVHKLDMRDGGANGCPPLPSRKARAAWQSVMQPAFENFRQAVVMAERFGAEQPWLDAYGATSPVEFFAVACEAYFVNRQRFTEDFAPLTDLFDWFFHPGKSGF